MKGFDQGILFDLDGTLWDASLPITHAWNKAIARRPDLAQPISHKALCALMGKTAPELVSAAFPGLSADVGMQLLQECFAEELCTVRAEGAAFYPGMAETLRQLSRRYAVGVVSNCQDGYVQLFLELSGLGDCVCDFECSGRTGRSKAENIRSVMQRLGLAKAVYLGDTQSDAAAAAGAGIPFLHAAYGFGSVPGSREIGSFAELESAVQELLR